MLSIDVTWEVFQSEMVPLNSVDENKLVIFVTREVSQPLTCPYVLLALAESATQALTAVLILPSCNVLGE
jgi:hypothetical protein